MIIKQVSVIAISCLLCTQLAKASVPPSKPDTTDLNTINIAANGELNERYLQADSDRNLLSERMSLPVKDQLELLQKQVPLHYNEHVQAYIDVYTAEKRKSYLARMVSLSAYYFPIYERVFAETGLPEEIKYLSIVESALDPHAVSRVGATGPWQFMFATARAFGLTIDSYMDERKDPIAASYAASAYLKDAYNEYGDWLLAIASYNCGKGNVSRAIQRSGKTNPSFWDIMSFLPRETRNYVPAYIALTYVLSNHEQLGIIPEPSNILLATETIQVDKLVPLKNIAEALSVDVQQLTQLNPAYKKEFINGSPESPKRLIVPQVDKSSYASLYAALNQQPGDENLQLVAASVKEETVETAVTHRVRKGENLGSIAKKYQVEVQDIRAWNHIKRNIIVPGQRLTVSQPTGKSHLKNTTNKPANYITYKVKRGDTLSEIADRHRGVTVSKLKAYNNIQGNGIRPGMVLKIAQN